MAAKKYFANLDLNQNQIKNAVLETVTSASVGAGAVAGQVIFDTGSNVFKYYDGAAWQSPVSRFDGAVVYKGTIAHNAASPGTVTNGDVYAFTSAGIATNYGGATVQVGDFVVYDSTLVDWRVIQGNVVQASTTAKGIVELATGQEAIDGTDTAVAISPASLNSWSEQENKTVTRKRVYTGQSIATDGSTILTHNIGKNNPYVSVYNSAGQRVHLEITKGNGTVILTSNTAMSNTTVVISA